MSVFTSFVYGALRTVFAFAPGGIEMRPVPFVPVRHTVLREKYDQLHAAEAPFPAALIVETYQPVSLRSHIP